MSALIKSCSSDLDSVCGSGKYISPCINRNTYESNYHANNICLPFIITMEPLSEQPTQQLPKMIGQLAGNAGRAFSNFASSSLQNLTTRKYTLPDKSVASQVLMYRQLLHTKCRPGLKLSRDYQGTPAQKAVLHMPVRLFIYLEEEIEQICSHVGFFITYLSGGKKALRRLGKWLFRMTISFHGSG